MNDWQDRENVRTRVTQGTPDRVAAPPIVPQSIYNGHERGIMGVPEQKEVSRCNKRSLLDTLDGVEEKSEKKLARGWGGEELQPVVGRVNGW